MNRQHPSFQHGQAVAMVARERPGEWVDLASGLTSAQASQKMHLEHWSPAPRRFFQLTERGARVLAKHEDEQS